MDQLPNVAAEANAIGALLLLILALQGVALCVLPWLARPSPKRRPTRRR